MMMRLTATAILAALMATACQEDGQLPSAAQVAVPSGTQAFDKEVLVASQPSDAKIFLKGAEVGATPMKLLVRGDTNLILEKEGFVKQALLITPRSEPNVVVRLVPDDAEGDGEAEVEETDPSDTPQTDDDGDSSSTAKTAKKKTKKSGDEGETASEDPPEESVTAPEPEPDPVPDPKAEASKAKKKVYTTMRQIKDDLSKGIITRDEYRKWQTEIRKERAQELQDLEKAYRAGEMTKSEFKDKVREIKLKYEG